MIPVMNIIASGVGMRGGEVKVQRATEGEASMPANQRMPASRCTQGPPRFDRLFASHWADLPLPKPF
jgi:hypothetical protein